MESQKCSEIQLVCFRSLSHFRINCKSFIPAALEILLHSEFCSAARTLAPWQLQTLHRLYSFSKRNEIANKTKKQKLTRESTIGFHHLINPFLLPSLPFPSFLFYPLLNQSSFLILTSSSSAGASTTLAA